MFLLCCSNSLCVRVTSTCMLILQKPGEAEAEFSTGEASTIIKMFHTFRTPGPIMIPKGIVANVADKPITLPSWLTEENVKYYADNFQKSGFTGGFNYYRAIDLYATLFLVLPIIYRPQYEHPRTLNNLIDQFCSETLSY